MFHNRGFYFKKELQAVSWALPNVQWAAMEKRLPCNKCALGIECDGLYFGIRNSFKTQNQIFGNHISDFWIDRGLPNQSPPNSTAFQ